MLVRRIAQLITGGLLAASVENQHAGMLSNAEAIAHQRQAGRLTVALL